MRNEKNVSSWPTIACWECTCTTGWYTRGWWLKGESMLCAHVFIDEVQATITRHESGNLLAVFDELGTHALADSGVGLLRLDATARLMRGSTAEFVSPGCNRQETLGRHRASVEKDCKRTSSQGQCPCSETSLRKGCTCTACQGAPSCRPSAPTGFAGEQSAACAQR